MKFDLTKKFTKDEAIEFAESEAWKEMTHEQRAALQLYQKRLCMPFDVFHESIEKALGRPVYTHEMGSGCWDGLVQELLGLKDSPSLDQIIDLIPAEKRIIVVS